MLKAYFIALVASFGFFHEASAFDHSHKLWGEVLEKFVTDQGHSSAVNYQGLKTNSEIFQKYLESLSVVKKSEFESWSREERLAFLINAYNAFTLKLIIDFYPVKSIRDIGRSLLHPFPNPWKDQKFIELFGEKTFLDHIEHDLIRPVFKEPRIHFAVNCASIGCPKLSTQPYTASNLEKQLVEASKLFLSDSTRNRWNETKSMLELSMIFDWYGEDFGEGDDGLKNFILPLMELSETQLAAARKAKIDFLEYNWSLNDHKERK